MTHEDLMHGVDCSDVSACMGWVAQEKFDGWRALWTGTQLITRQGERIDAPAWFTAGLPDMPLDCELYLGRGQLGKIGGMAWNSESPLWRKASLVIFDAPMADGGYIARLDSIHHCCVSAYVAPISTVAGNIKTKLKQLKSIGGEGFMLREPNAPYRAGRTGYLQKLK